MKILYFINKKFNPFKYKGAIHSITKIDINPFQLIYHYVYVYLSLVIILQKKYLIIYNTIKKNINNLFISNNK